MPSSQLQPLVIRPRAAPREEHDTIVVANTSSSPHPPYHPQSFCEPELEPPEAEQEKNNNNFNGDIPFYEEDIVDINKVMCKSLFPDGIPGEECQTDQTRILPRNLGRLG
ncbi:hypothetical protein PG995_005339 [Apiospora arundinis]